MNSELTLKGLNILNELLNGKYENHTGWLRLPFNIDVKEIIELANKIRKNSEVLVVVGVGGSYLGSRAVIEALSSKYNRDIEIIYLGNSLSALDLREALEYLEDKKFTVNVISKSGTTLEPALAFRSLRQLLFSKFSEKEAQERIIVTTGEGVLKEHADRNNLRTLSIPDDVGGRYSVLTPVGLLPIAVAGIDIERLISGARASFKANTSLNSDNEAVGYAKGRVELNKNGKDIEVLAYYEPRLHYFAEWWKQLYGESEGKDGKGIFPVSACFTTDLHSLGQIIQDGKRNLFETHLSFVSPTDLWVKADKDDFDGLNYLANARFSMINEKAKKGTIEAHTDGGVPIISIEGGELNEFNIGYLIHFFQLSCAISACLMEVNPFDQPGVEAYKKNMNRLLKDSF